MTSENDTIPVIPIQGLPLAFDFPEAFRYVASTGCSIYTDFDKIDGKDCYRIVRLHDSPDEDQFVLRYAGQQLIHGKISEIYQYFIDHVVKSSSESYIYTMDTADDGAYYQDYPRLDFMRPVEREYREKQERKYREKRERRLAERELKRKLSLPTEVTLWDFVAQAMTKVPH